jgi:cytoskeletal protein CcmA (bactofilin family)
MFSSKTKNSDAASVPMPSVPQQKRAVRSSAPSIISADLVVSGTLTSTGDIQIDGRVEGDVRSAGLVVGDKAFIQGEVLAEDLTVRGRIQGSIRARKVLLCSTCHVEGNILHEAFSVETGAFFEGNCRHSDNPLSEEAGGCGARCSGSSRRRCACCSRSRRPTDDASGRYDTAPGSDLRTAQDRRLISSDRFSIRTPFRESGTGFLFE